MKFDFTDITYGELLALGNPYVDIIIKFCIWNKYCDIDLMNTPIDNAKLKLALTEAIEEMEKCYKVPAIFDDVFK